MRFTLNGKRYDTERMQTLGIATRKRQHVSIEGVYLTKRSRRVFVWTDSDWEDRNRPGCCIGHRVHEADREEIARLAMEHDCDALYELLEDDSE